METELIWYRSAFGGASVPWHWQRDRAALATRCLQWWQNFIHPQSVFTEISLNGEWIDPGPAENHWTGLKFTHLLLCASSGVQQLWPGWCYWKPPCSAQRVVQSVLCDTVCTVLFARKYSASAEQFSSTNSILRVLRHCLSLQQVPLDTPPL